MSETPRLTLDELLAHQGWVRRLAARLVGDAAADDLVQETWLAATSSPPAADRPARPWLARVVTNLARQRRRSEGRRERREAAGARAEALPSAAELAERLDASQRVACAVAALAEPYRSTVLLRYFEDLAPAEIARRQGLPPATVRARLARGLARLRRDLDAEWGGRERWCAALAPLALGASGESAGRAGVGAVLAGALSGLFAMSLPVKIATAAATLAVALVVTRTLVDPGEPDLAPAAVARTSGATAVAPPLPAAAGAGDDARAAVGSAAGASARAGRDAGTVPAPVSEGPAPEVMGSVPMPLPSTPLVVGGRVVDLAGAPLAGVGVGLDARFSPGLAERHPGVLATSAADGSFELVVEGQSGVLVCADSSHITLRAARFGSSSAQPRVVAAPARALAGRVQDPDGRPIAGAAIEVSVPRDVLGVGAMRADALPAPAAATTTAADGAFRLERVADVERALVRITALGHADHQGPLPAIRAGWTVVLPWRGGDRPSTIAGRVIDADGAPVAGATVGYVTAHARTGEDGRFHVLVDRTLDDASLVAARPGARPAVRQRFGAELAARGGVATGVELVLAGPPLAIAGRVVDAEGRPFAHARVLLLDPTLGRFDLETYEATTAESLAGGAVECPTDGRGRFRLTGLWERDYALAVIHERTLASATVEGVAAGTRDLEIVLPRAEETRVLRGRVVDRDGRPVPFAHVTLLPTVDYRRQGANAAQRAVTTEASGAFAFDWIPASPLVVSAVAQDTDYRTVEVDGAAALEPLRIELGRLVAVRVELADPALGADAFALLDADGAPVQLASDGRVQESASLVTGRSEPLRASDRAETLVLRAGEVEVARVPVRLAADGENVLTGP